MWEPLPQFRPHPNPISEKEKMAHTADLPTELLSLIFLLCTDEAKNEAHLKSSLISITHVPKYWRNVALGCPSLWNKLHVGDHDSDTKINTLLQRSGNMPLYATFNHCGVAHAFLVHANRWRRIEIQNYDRILSLKATELLLSYSLHELPRLEMLKLIGTGAALTEGTSALELADQAVSFETPQLERLVINDFSYNRARFNVSIERLIHVEIHETSRLR
ncbi:hypothetical protein FRC03_003886 [Tulasnella sp. 419]|nr:hypothetical protein FRC03_003886 [Tulasnella sp. 419]